MMPPTRTRVRTSAAMRYAEQRRESFDAIKGTYPSDHMDILRKEASSMDHRDDDVPTALGSYVVERYQSEATGAPNGAGMDLDQVNLDVDNTGARAPRAGVVNSSTRFLLLRRALGMKISGEELKTAQMSLFLFVYYLVWNWFRFDSLFAASTLAIYEDALSKLPGVSATSSPYCSRMPDGVLRDLHSGEKCVLAFRDAIEVDDLYNFLTTELLDIPGALFGVCENCAMSITQSPKGIQVLTEADFICTDSDVHEFGTAELTTKPSCMLDELIGQPGSIDYEWAANPTTLTAPCCNNATLILASMLLLSRSSLSGGGVAADDLADLMLMNANRLNDAKRGFVLQHVHGDGNFVQVLVSRGERVLGLKYGAFFQDEGCRDPNFVKHWNENHDGMLATNGTYENTYDAASTSTLKQCYSDRWSAGRSCLESPEIPCCPLRDSFHHL